MNRKASLLILLGTVVLVGVLFFRVVQPFLFPLFFAAVLALLSAPLQEWLAQRLHGRRRVAAGLTTVLILGLGLVPLGTALYFAGEQLVGVAQELLDREQQAEPLVDRVTVAARAHLDEDQVRELRRSVLTKLRDVSTQMFERTQSLVSNVIGFAVGLIIMILSLYYFLADGPAILKTIQNVSPLENEDETELFREFERVSRGVILATLLCALAQAVLAGIGFAVAGVTQFWLLAGLTMITSMIPFLGSASIWGATALVLALEEHYARAGGLALYGLLVISTSDNLIRAYVIHGTSNLHPLVVLISVLGALQVVGLWGVFVGPMTAAFFYALLKILHRRLETPELADG